MKEDEIRSLIGKKVAQEDRRLKTAEERKTKRELEREQKRIGKRQRIAELKRDAREKENQPKREILESRGVPQALIALAKASNESADSEGKAVKLIPRGGGVIVVERDGIYCLGVGHFTKRPNYHPYEAYGLLTIGLLPKIFGNLEIFVASKRINSPSNDRYRPFFSDNNYNIDLFHDLNSTDEINKLVDFLSERKIRIYLYEAEVSYYLLNIPTPKKNSERLYSYSFHRENDTSSLDSEYDDFLNYYPSDNIWKDMSFVESHTQFLRFPWFKINKRSRIQNIYFPEQ